MPKGFRLVDAMNTHNPSLIALREKGYDLGVYADDSEDEDSNSTDGQASSETAGYFWARKEDHEFVAGDPLALLGLVAVWEHRGDLWRSDTDADVYGELMENTYGD